MDGEIHFEDNSKNMRFGGAEHIRVDGLVLAVRDRWGDEARTEIWAGSEGGKGADDIRGMGQDIESLRTEIASLRAIVLALRDEYAKRFYGNSERLNALEQEHPKGKSHEVTVKMEADPVVGQVVVSKTTGRHYRVVGHDDQYTIARVATVIPENAVYRKFAKGEFETTL